MIEPLIKAAMYPYSLLFVTTPIMYMIMSQHDWVGVYIELGIDTIFSLNNAKGDIYAACSVIFHEILTDNIGCDCTHPSTDSASKQCIN